MNLFKYDVQLHTENRADICKFSTAALSVWIFAEATGRQGVSKLGSFLNLQLMDLSNLESTYVII